MTIPIIVFLIFLYLLMGGAAWRLACNYGDKEWAGGPGELFAILFSAAFWPLAIPMFTGNYIVNYLTGSLTPRVPRETQKELLIKKQQNEIMKETIRLRALENEELARSIALANGEIPKPGKREVVKLTAEEEAKQILARGPVEILGYP